jgi:hypothetical protein
LAPVDESETEVAVVLNRDHGAFDDLSKVPFLRTGLVKDKKAYFISIKDIDAGKVALGVGPRTLARVIKDIGLKSTQGPGGTFSISNKGEVLLPSNLDSAADSLAYRFIILYIKLGLKVLNGGSQVSIPNFSQGWDTNMGYILDILTRISSNLLVDKHKREMLPTKLGQPIGRRLVSIIAYKWATMNNMAAYLSDEVKIQGNISRVAWFDIVKGWGTPVEGNLAQALAGSIFDLTGFIASRVEIKEMMPCSFFMDGTALRAAAIPSRQVVEKVGNKQRVVVKGNINVLRFDNIRFLLPRERAEAKKMNESSDLEKQIRRFDGSAISDRNYPEMIEKIKDLVDSNSTRYFNIRRASRQRLYAVKEVRREAKQPDIVQDAEFASDLFIESAIKQAESIIIDIGRKRSVIDRLKSDIFTTTVRAEKPPRTKAVESPFQGGQNPTLEEETKLKAAVAKKVTETLSGSNDW